MSIVCDLEDDVHVSSFPWQGNGWRRTRVQRRWLIRVGRDRLPVSAYLLAVVELQRIWRGILLRRRVLKKYISASFARAWKLEELSILNAYRAVPRAPESAFGELVKRVQARWRAVLLRTEFSRWEEQQRWPIYWVAAATIQRAWVDFQYHRNLKRHRNRSKRFFKTKLDHAAGKIQNIWKCYVQRRIYRFYLQLIRFRERGDPALMLKCIDLGEAAMNTDKAAGLHVRFRLGGATFPPIILYKVFTHNNVADVGSFAPKDYANIQKASIAESPAARHSKRPKRPADRSNWYQRIDNNNWRPVDTAVLTDAEKLAELADIQATKHANIIPQGAPYHYSRLKRQQEKILQSKQTRRIWLAELYSSEQCRQRPNLDRTKVEENAKRIFNSLGENEVEEEVRRLTDWTQHLDFEKYRQDWLAQATTAGSDAKY